MAARKCNELAALPKKAPKDPAKVPFETLCAWIFRSGTSFDVNDEGALNVDIGQNAPTWLVEVLQAHSGALLHLAKCRCLDDHIESRIRKLQDGADENLRQRGVIYLTKKCQELEELCKSPVGYTDPASLFSYDCLEGYRETLSAIK